MFQVSSVQIADLQRKHHLDNAEIYCDELRRSRALGSKLWDDDALIEDTKHYIGVALDELKLTSVDDVLGFLKLRHSVCPRFYEITRSASSARKRKNCTAWKPYPFYACAVSGSVLDEVSSACRLFR